jgi:hypothetical protein
VEWCQRFPEAQHLRYPSPELLLSEERGSMSEAPQETGSLGRVVVL